MKKIGGLIIQNPKSKIKIRDVEKGEFIFFEAVRTLCVIIKKSLMEKIFFYQLVELQMFIIFLEMQHTQQMFFV